MFIIKNKKIFIGISIFLTVASLISLFVFGLRFSIDFKGGSLMEVSFPDTKIEQIKVEETLAKFDIGTAVVQKTGENGFLIKSTDISEKNHTEILKALSDDGKIKIEENNFNSIGPSVGHELARKAILALILVSLAIICFIAFAFRKVSKPVSSWRYGIIAVVTLLHDVLIPVGIFSFISHYNGVEADTLFVVAILTILGLSVSDTIVVFDRIRENLKNHSGANFSETIGKSLSQVYPRSINTSLTVILSLLALVFFGPAATKYFALMMTAGMFFGTYSSIFLASPLLVLSEELQSKKTK